jgi:hypothetical protein
MNAKIRATGRAAAEVIRWLHGKPVRPIVLDQPIDHAAEPRPRDADELDHHIRIALAPAVGMMAAAGGKPEHYVTRADPGVAHALMLAGRVNEGDPVSVLEQHYADLIGTLGSPRIAAAVHHVAAKLMRAPGGQMDRHGVEGAIRGALCAGESRAAFVGFGLPQERRIYVDRDEPRR